MGALSRDDDEYIKRLNITPKKSDSLPSDIKRIDTSNYKDLIMDVPVPNRHLYKTNAYATLTISTMDILATLSDSLLKSSQVKDSIYLMNLQNEETYTPIVEQEYLKAPDDIIPGLHALVFKKGMPIGNDALLEESIYFLVYID